MRTAATLAILIILGSATLVRAEVAEQVAGDDGHSYTLVDNSSQNVLNAVDEAGVWIVSAAVSDDANAVLSLDGFVPDEAPSGTPDEISQSDASRRQSWLTVERGTEHVIEIFEERAGHFTETISVVGLSPVVASSDAISLVDDDGVERIRYSNLFVIDALNRVQTSWFEANGSQIEIHVEADEDAAWPITIDPILTVPVTIPCPASVCENQGPPMPFNGGQFGTGVAVGILTPGPGCTTCSATKPAVLIGVPFINASTGFARRGGVAVFTLNASNQLVFDSFHAMAFSCGFDVAIGDVRSTSDNDVIVGCPTHDLGSSFDEGVIQVHNGPGFGGGTSGSVQLVPDDTGFATEDRNLGRDLEVGRIRNGAKADIVATTIFHHGLEPDRKLLIYSLDVSDDPTIAGFLPLQESNTTDLGFHTDILNIDGNSNLDVAVGTPTGVRLFLGTKERVHFFA